MTTVILDALESESSISKALEGKLGGREVSCFKVKNMNVQPCRSCGGCSYKSPGKCVVKDDVHEILRAIAKCDNIVMLAPIQFGGYPSDLKKVIDKFMILALPTYTVKNGHMLHPSRYGIKTLLGIGVSEEKSEAQEESFKRLVEHNAFNLQYAHKALVLKAADDMPNMERQIEDFFRDTFKAQSSVKSAQVCSSTLEGVQK